MNNAYLDICDPFYQTETFLCMTPNRDMAKNTCEGDFYLFIFFNIFYFIFWGDFEVFTKSKSFMCLNCNVKVSDQNLKPKWYNFDDFWHS